MNRRDERPGDVFGTGRRQPIELWRLDEAVVLLDTAGDLRCAAGPESVVKFLTGLDRPGVLVRLTPRAATFECSITVDEDVVRGNQQMSLSLRADHAPSWVALLVTHRRADFRNADIAAGVVRAEPSIYEHIRLDEPPRNLGIFEAPRTVTQAGELVALALRAAGCPIGQQVRERPSVEHPDLYLE